mmetsp:Transcript_83421/g.166553  ORF Transcript_83421/g.166553 Transcript_83421/m.166553 type:complete len:247 (-) Transcript_83421:144-884(-)
MASRGTRSVPAPALVDTVNSCREQCARLSAAGVVACDFEGANLCRDGELHLAQLAAVDGPVVLIDVAQLGQAAFDEGGLRDLLQSTSVLKLIFDGRADSDALYHLHKTRLTNVCDCQVLCASHLEKPEAGGGGPSAGRLPGLGKALAECPGLDGEQAAALAQLKKAAHAHFAADLGGSPDAWKQRPLPAALIEYAAADVTHLHAMYEHWGALVDDETMRSITTRRIDSAISGGSAARGAHMARRDF